MKRIGPAVISLFVMLMLASVTAIAQKPILKFNYGKYGCTASKYNNGMYEFLPRGFIKFEKNGTYTYSGYQNPSKGQFRLDPAGSIVFSGGYLDKGKAEKVDKQNKYLLVFPSNPDNRWTCTWIP